MPAFKLKKIKFKPIYLFLFIFLLFTIIFIFPQSAKQIGINKYSNQITKINFSANDTIQEITDADIVKQTIMVLNDYRFSRCLFASKLDGGSTIEWLDDGGNILMKLCGRRLMINGKIYITDKNIVQVLKSHL